MLAPNDYGVEQFSAFYVSVASDPEENATYCKMNNRAGRFKDVLTGKMIPYVGISIPIDPERVLKARRDTLPQMLSGLLLEHLERPAYVMPDKFDRVRLLADLKAALRGN